jgi:hypothetical protein
LFATDFDIRVVGRGTSPRAEENWRVQRALAHRTSARLKQTTPPKVNHRTEVKNQNVAGEMRVAHPHCLYFVPGGQRF